MHFILILGMVGLDREGQITKAYYSYKDNDSDDNIDFTIKAGEYINSLHVLATNFKGEKFTLIGTKAAKEKQEKVFQVFENECKDGEEILKHLAKTEILDMDKEDDLALIFNLTLNAILNSPSDNIILDITHGLRHQPLMAAFAATLGKINFNKSIKILFAQEIERLKTYSYVFLDNYNNITTYAILLNGFIQTLSIPKIHHTSSFINSLQDFTDSLHTNAFDRLFATTLPKTLENLNAFKQDSMYFALKDLINQVEKILNKFANIKNMQYDYEKYYAISQIMFEKKYYLISITYGFESLPKYVLLKFKLNNILKPSNATEYEQSQAIQQFVLQKISENKIFAYDKACLYYDTYKNEFEQLSKIWTDLKDIRNNLVHISQEFSAENLVKNLENRYQEFETLCIKGDKFQRCDFSKLENLEKLTLKIYDYFNKNFNYTFAKDFKKMSSFIRDYKEGRKDLSISEVNKTKLANNKNAQQILNFLYRHKDSNYLTIKQCLEINKIF